MSSQLGYAGLSVLHELRPLYGFDTCIIRGLVYDIHHNLPLNVIKNQVDRLVETGILHSKQVEQRMSLHLVVNQLNFTHVEDIGKQRST